MENEQSPQQVPTSRLKHHQPYLTSDQIDRLSEKQRGKLSSREEIRTAESACALLEAIGARMGFPRRTIATAQNLYHRFHLFFPRKNFERNDVALGSLYVSTKMHDTLKKPRELLAVAYAFMPEFASRSKNPSGEIDLDSIDPLRVEHDRSRLLGVERLVLETICFNFTSRVPFPYVIKLGKAFSASKKLTKLAWRLTADAHRTVVPIQYPPHTVALGCLNVAAHLTSFEQPKDSKPEGCRGSHEIAATLSQHGDWERRFQSQVEDLEVIAHTILDLLIRAASQNASANTSPRTPQSPSPNSAPRNQHLLNPFNMNPYRADQLTRLKIELRRTEHPPLPNRTMRTGNPDPGASLEETASLVGQNEGTVRFLFGPPGA
ncbi:cyclin-like protein [Mycena floridula]|nr:cyclin-like protein [Mycena floridula]